MAHRIAFIVSRGLDGALTYSGSPLISTYDGDVISVTPVGAASATAVSSVFADADVQFTLNDPGATAASYAFNVTWDDGAGGTVDVTTIDVIVLPPFSFVRDGECSYEPEWPTDAQSVWGGLTITPGGSSNVAGSNALYFTGPTFAGDALFPATASVDTTPSEGGALGGEVMVAYRLHDLAGQGGSPLARIDVFPVPLPSLSGPALSPALEAAPTVTSPSGLVLDAQLRPMTAPADAGDQDLELELEGTGVFAGTTLRYPRAGVTPVTVRRIDFDVDEPAAAGGPVERIPSQPVADVAPAERDFAASSGSYAWSLGAGSASEVMLDDDSTGTSAILTWSSPPTPGDYGVELVGAPADSGSPVAAGAFVATFEAVSEMDAGVSMDDAGIPSEDDAGTSPADLGVRDGGASTDGGSLDGGIEDDPDDDGCGCRTAGAPTGRVPWWGLPVVAVIARRRLRGVASSSDVAGAIALAAITIAAAAAMAWL